MRVCISMTENEDKLLITLHKDNDFKKFLILKYIVNTLILNNYLRLYYWNILSLFNMEFISENKISEELVNSFNEDMTLELAKRLEEDDYMTPFDGLKDWHLLRALAINRPELTSDYIHLLDQEPFDEN